MKILFADFKIAKYGGIVEHVVAKVRALQKLGHEVDIVQIAPQSIQKANYDKRIKQFRDKTYDGKLVLQSQNLGYEFEPYTGYWKNPYYGFFLPPNRLIGAFDDDALLKWYDLVDGVDLIIWNFMPTQNEIWKQQKGKELDFWWRFFDLPSDEIKQIFIVHDAYFDVRASQITALKEKVLFLDCAHIAAYRCCENIGIPRTLLLNPRFFDDKDKMPEIKMSSRPLDFFSAHIFKPNKKMDSIIRAFPYLNGQCSLEIAGSGIEQAYMTAGQRSAVKPVYLCDRKYDPDLPEKYVGKNITIWNRAMESGMEYVGQLSYESVANHLQNSKFAIDASYSSHYAQYCRTHINGFTIEAIMNGCHPIYVDYSGDENIKDILFDNLNAIVIPFDVTPKQFAGYMKKALKLDNKTYRHHTLHNYEVVRELFNAETNMKEVLRLVKGGKRLINKELEIGVDSKKVTEITEKTMKNFFHIDLPIQWLTD